MRWWVASFATLIGCTGEQVTPGSGTDASIASESSVDTAVATDSASTEVSDAACPKYADNLIPDGDFSMGFGGWRAESCLIEATPGPCGSALRVYNITTPARVEVSYAGKTISKTSKLHFRAWFKRGKDAPPSATPSVFIRSFYLADGGEKSEDYPLSGSLTTEWRLAERVFNLKEDQTEGMQVMIDGYHEADGKSHDFMVADISLVIE
jgi:hypothetical protein